MIDQTMLKDRRVVKSTNLSTLTKIGIVDSIITKRVDNLFLDIQNRYKIDESKLYERLYLKVRKMFLEEED